MRGLEVPHHTLITTFETVKEGLVKVGISVKYLIFLTLKVMINKFKSTISCELSLSVVLDIIPSRVFLKLFGIRLNIFY